MNKAVLVSGGTGFIGAHICKALAQRGESVICADIKPIEVNPQLNWFLEPVKNKIMFLKLDTTDLAGLLRATRDHQVGKIIHASAMTDSEVILNQPLLTMKSIVGGSLNIFETARILNLKRVIYISSIAVYSSVEYEPMDEDHPVLRSDQPPPLAAYSSSKLAAESFGLCYWGYHGLDFLAFRLSAVYGFGMQYPMYIKPMVEDALSGRPSKFQTGGDMSRDYTYVKDVVRGILLALDNQTPFQHRIFNLSSGEPPVKASQLAKIIRQILPNASIAIGNGLDEIEEKQVKSRGRLSIERARKEFGYEPKYSLTEGIKDYIQSYTEYMEKMRK